MSFRNGIDFVGWRDCEKQKELGPGRFPMHVSTLAMNVAMAPQVPDQLPDATAAVSADRRRQLQQFQQIKAGAAEWARGTPECKACPISGGNPYGCHAFLRKPIDEVAERALFDFFVSQLDIDGSICKGLYKDLVSKQPASDTQWHTDRGVNGEHAVLAEPLEHKFGFFLSRKRIDSAQILGALFFTQKRVTLIALFARFWREFMAFARSRGIPVGTSPVLMDMGTLEQLYNRLEEHSAEEASVAMIVPE